MALQGTFTQLIKSGNLTAQASVQNAYMRLADARVDNRYIRQGEPVTVFKQVEAVGRLDVYALAADPANGIEPITSAEYRCPHVAGAVVEMELYAHLMTLPEFAGCVAV